MKRLFPLVLALMLMFSVSAIAEEAAVETAEITYVEVALDSEIMLDGDFSAMAVIQRTDGSCDGGIVIYKDAETGNAISFKVRWNEDARADFYGAKDVNGTWGFRIADEYYEWLKDCFVSVDEGWDASTDTAMTLTVTVVGTMATVTMKGNVTGMEGTINFDLTKSPWLDYEEKETEVLVLNSGTLGLSFNGGEALQLFVDEATYLANQE